MLQTTRKTVLQVAGEVGYDSEAAFNRAFKREFGFLRDNSGKRIQTRVIVRRIAGRLAGQKSAHSAGDHGRDGDPHL